MLPLYLCSLSRLFPHLAPVMSRAARLPVKRKQGRSSRPVGTPGNQARRQRTEKTGEVGMSQKNKGRLSRMGLAAANILRGAVTGGLHGAAIKAAESLAPTLLKWIAGILCLLLLLPTLI